MPKQISDNSNALPRDFYAITALSLWRNNEKGPGFVMPDGSRVYSAGFFPLFDTKEEAEKVAAAFPGALVIPVPISVFIGDKDAK